MFFRPRGYPAPAATKADLARIKLPDGPAPGATPRLDRLEVVERQRDMATDQRNDAYRIVEEARMEAAALLNMEREHLGAGRDGHISESDLVPLLRVLQIEVDR